MTKKLAFILPALVLVLAFAVNGIYPFGTQHIAIIDMYHQYLPFLSELQEKLRTGGSLFYSWNGGGGCNFWNLFAYYCASPLNLLLVIFPARLLSEGVTLILMIKLCLASGFMYMFLDDRKSGNNWAALAMSLCYALNAFVMGYYWCIMWMDALMLLPLCIMGLRDIIRGRSPVLYIVSLALTAFCNYYMAIMVCFFIVVYYPVCFFSKSGDEGGNGAKNGILTAVKTLGASALGLAMISVLLLPTATSMGDTYYAGSGAPDRLALLENFSEILRQFLPAGELTSRDGLPNLYCGIAVAILLIVYVICKSIPLREKLLHVGLFVFLILSLNLNVLNYIWHGCHYPNQLPYRFSFVIIFLAIAMAYRAFRQIDRKRLALILVLVVTADMCVNTCMSFEETGGTDREGFAKNAREIRILTEEIGQGEKDNPELFGRTEVMNGIILNQPMLYGSRGVSLFTSTLNANASILMNSLGLDGEPAANRYNYNTEKDSLNEKEESVLNAMLNIRYLITGNKELKDSNFEYVKRRGYARLYESRYPTAIAYMAPDAITEWAPEAGNTEANMNSYISLMSDGKYDLDSWDKAYSEIYSEKLQVEKFSDGKIEGTVTAEKAGVLVSSVPYENGWTVYVDGSEKEIEKVGGSWISVRLEPGSHEIEFRFMPPGFYAGLAVTLICLAIFAVICIRTTARGRRAGTPPPESQPEESDYSTE